MKIPDSVKSKPMYGYLLIMTITAAVGLQGWRTLFNNFAVDIVGLNGSHIGIIQTVREVPGFLALLAVFMLLFIKEHRLSALSVTLLGVGVLITGIFPSYIGLLFTTFLMSVGFHYYETTNQSLTLQYFSKKESPLVMGRQRSFSSAANIAIGVFILATISFISFEIMYFLIGSSIIIVGIWGFTVNPSDPNAVPQHKKMILRKKYSLFYTLTLLAGARRQIFMVFSVLLLVEKFNYNVLEITALFVLNNLINYFLAPVIGKSINKFGERKILSLEYGSLIFIFLAYAYTDSKILVAALYILDHVFFNFAMAIRTYFQKIADPKDVAPSMAVSFTINHIAAVVLPALGGFLWLMDNKIPFIIGAVLSVFSLIAVQFTGRWDIEEDMELEKA